MKFDIANVATSANQLGLREGDKVVVANTMQMLERKVLDDREIISLSHILPNNYERCFCVDRTDCFLDDVETSLSFALAYPVRAEKEKKKCVPYKNRAELVVSYQRLNGGDFSEDTPIPSIWVKQKSTGNIYQIVGFSSNNGEDAGVFIYYVGFVSYPRLLHEFVFKGNVACGIIEE